MTKKVTRKNTSASAVNFEAALAELEALVERMEQGESSLEDSLKDFERGIELTRRCQAALAEAEQKVQILLQKDGEAVDFDAGGRGDFDAGGRGDADTDEET